MPNQHGKLEYVETVHWVTQGGGGGAPTPSRKMSKVLYKCNRCGQTSTIDSFRTWECDPDGSIHARWQDNLGAKKDFEEFYHLFIIPNIILSVCFNALLVLFMGSNLSSLLSFLTLMCTCLFLPYILYYPFIYCLVRLIRFLRVESFINKIDEYIFLVIYKILNTSEGAVYKTYEFLARLSLLAGFIAIWCWTTYQASLLLAD